MQCLRFRPGRSQAPHFAALAGLTTDNVRPSIALQRAGLKSGRSR
jgi:hypothetical protein